MQPASKTSTPFPHRGLEGPTSDGTIAAAVRAGIRLEDLIEMTRLARETDSGAARFLDAWDALAPSEQEAPDAADALCERLGLASLKLLRAAADAGCRFSVCLAQITAALNYPAVMEKTVDSALTDKGYADRVVLHKIMGFLPTPKGSRTAIPIFMEKAQGSAMPTAEQLVAGPSPVEKIRRLQERFNEARGLPPLARNGDFGDERQGR